MIGSDLVTVAQQITEYMVQYYFTTLAEDIGLHPKAAMLILTHGNK